MLFFTKINKINTYLCMHSLRIYAFVVLQLSKRWMQMNEQKNVMYTNKQTNVFGFLLQERSYQQSMVAAQPSKQNKKKNFTIIQNKLFAYANARQYIHIYYIFRYVFYIDSSIEIVWFIFHFVFASQWPIEKHACRRRHQVEQQLL